MHECGAWESAGLTAREEVEAILSDRWAEIGLVGPMVGVGWIPGFLARITSECGGLRLSADPFDLARAAGFRVRSIYLPGRCGASTATTLFVQSQGTVHERNLSCLHELLHSLGLRFGLYLNEVDWWLATAGFVAHVCGMPGGADLYPLWMMTASLALLIPR